MSRRDAFEKYATLDPSLWDLERRVRDAAAGDCDRDVFWYGEVKPALRTAVGWCRPVPGGIQVEVVRESPDYLTYDELMDRAVRQQAADEAALERADPHAAYLHRELATSAAYDAAYKYLNDVLYGME